MGLSSFIPSALAESGCILVVDDDILIRMDVADRLRECGFEVIEADCAAEAVAVLSQDRGPEQTGRVGLVFSDVQMPGEMDGFGLVRWIAAHHPGLPVILASGVVRAKAAREALCGAVQFIEKPYREGEVARAALGVFAQEGARRRAIYA